MAFGQLGQMGQGFGKMGGAARSKSLAARLSDSEADFGNLDYGAFYTTSTGETLGDVGDSYGLGLNLGGMGGLDPQTWIDQQENLYGNDSWALTNASENDDIITFLDDTAYTNCVYGDGSTLVLGDYYRLDFSVTEVTNSGTIRVRLGGASSSSILDTISAPADYSVILQMVEAPASLLRVENVASPTFLGSLGNFSVKHLGSSPIISDVSADRPTVVETDGKRSLLFDGVSDEIKITNSGQTYFCFGVQSTDEAAILFYGQNENTQFTAIAQATGALPANGTDDATTAPQITVDGISLNSPTRDDFYQAAFDGEKHVIEVIGADVSTWGDYIFMGARASFELAGNIFPPITRTTTPTDAERALYRQYVSRKFGVSS